ncbi:MAG: cysteine desulfurase-like protein [Myxococcales bacterium]|nr:cysteine desulfurase-like protein [Myxococcales bacterium]
MHDLDLDFVRAQFPALASDTVFLENAGGSQTLAAVADRIRDYLLTTNVQLGASYAASQASTARVREAARETAAFVGASDPECVILGPSTTQLLNNLALAMQGGLVPGDEIVVSAADHAANVGCWRRLAARGIVVKTWPIDRDTWRLEPAGLLPLLGPRTKLVAFTHVSNLLGTIHDVAGLTRLVHEHGARVVVDGVAFAPHREVEVEAWDVDYYVFSFYKVFGPHVAVLYGKRECLERLDTINHDFITELPYRLQPGNLNFELAHGLGGIYAYLDALGGRCPGAGSPKSRAFAAIAAHEERLAAPLLAALAARPGVTIFGDRRPLRDVRVPTISFAVAGRTAESIVRAVDPSGIGIRHGDFYAKALAAELGVPDREVVRVSMVHYNTPDEIERLIAVLDRVL